MKKEICSKCGLDLNNFIDVSCTQCAMKYDPNEPSGEEELDFSRQTEQHYEPDFWDIEDDDTDDEIYY